MKREIKNFTKEEVEKAVLESKSYASVAKKLGINYKSGHYVEDVKKWINRYCCDTSHFTGMGWNKNNFNLERLKTKKIFKGPDLLRLLLYGFKRERKCEVCGNTEWNNDLIPLQVHHIDGNHYNNNIDNLQIICPNCHAQTDSYCGRNIDKKKNITDEELVEAIQKSSSISEVFRNTRFCDTTNHRERIKDVIEKYGVTLKPKPKKEKKKKIITKENKIKNKEKQELIKQKKKEQENNFKKRIKYFLSNKIDITKFGWVEKASKDLGISHTQVRRWVSKNLPELNFFKRNKVVDK